MAGRIRRKQRLTQPLLPTERTPPVCPLCDRPIPASQQDEHHLVPKSRGGRETLTLHRICHRQIHALLTEKALAESYATIPALRAHPEIARFIQWVRRKPNDFYERTRKSIRLRSG